MFILDVCECCFLLMLLSKKWWTLPLTLVQPSKLWIYVKTCRPLIKHMHYLKWLHAARLENYCWITVVLSRNNCVFSQRVLKQRVSGQEESAFWLDGLEDSVSRSTLSYLVVFVFVCPSDCFNTLMVELLTLLSFSFSRPIGYTGATERLRLWRFRLQGTI